MKPNDKAFEAAKKTYNIHSDYDAEAVSLRLAVDAAFAAQFPPSEDYAGLIEWLRNKAESLSEIYPPEAEAADALEAVLAERDALRKWKEDDSAAMRIFARYRELEAELAVANKRAANRLAVEAERDALLARLAPVNDKELVEIAAVAIRRNKFERRGRLDWFNPIHLTLEKLEEARAAIAAIRPHIEAAERERCAKIVEGACTATNNPLIVKILHGNYQSLVDRDFKIAAAIRSGK